MPSAAWPLAAALLAAAAAAAQDHPAVEAVPKDLKEVLGHPAPDAKPRPEGWVFTGRAGASLSGLHNANMVGQVDGFTFQGGTMLGSTASFFAGQHEWRNFGAYELSMLKTPTIEHALKGADNLELRSLYLYRVPGFEWFGPFVRGRAFTPLLPGFAVPAADVAVRRHFVDGTEQVTHVPGQQRIPLTTFLEPLVVTETAGLFLRPLERPWLTVDAKVGAGAQHIITAGGFVVADAAATPELDLRQLQTIHSMGAELEGELKGVVLKDVSYGLLATVYYPLLLSEQVELTAVERVNLDLVGTLSYRLTKWLSADYMLRVRRVPFVLNDWQVQNSLLLTVGASSL